MPSLYMETIRVDHDKKETTFDEQASNFKRKINP
jgi:hypothetical protein